MASFVMAIVWVTLVQLHTAQTADFVKNVHIIFMNHLDVGYNVPGKGGFINDVLNVYFTQYFPRAISMAQQLTSGGYAETFKYTTHPWLVSMYLDCPPNLVLSGVKLQCPNTKEIATFTSAVKAGYITWHAGTMNIQSENNLPWLYDFGLQLADDLDKRFSIKRAAKVISQRDVPGMTQAVIPSLVKSGVIGVSVGVNSGSAPPAVPPIFRWRYGQQEVLGTWVKGGYPNNPGPNPRHPGGISRKDCVIIPNFPDVLCYAFRLDNTGPPTSIQEILNNYEILRVEFPNADVIKASTFEDYFLGVKKNASQLPVLTNEIGDTWIQGIASDPRKMAEFRAVARVMGQCLGQGKCNTSDPRVYNASRILLKLPEHTWGFYSVRDNSNWKNMDFHRVQSGANYQTCVKTWLEQREFTYVAIDALQTHPVVGDIRAEMGKLTPARPDLTGWEPLAPSKWQQPFQCSGDIVLSFGLDGSVQGLSYKGVKVATSQYPMAKVMYNTYNDTDIHSFDSRYSYSNEPGYAKGNLTVAAHPDSRSWPVALRDMYMRNGSSCDFYLHLEMVDKVTWSYYGAPQDIWIRHTVRTGSRKPGLDSTFQWFDKTSTRLPESLMLTYMTGPVPGMKWTMSKLGQKVDPMNVLLNGSQYQHAVDDAGVFYTSANGSGVHVYSPDVPLVAPMTTTKKAPPTYPTPLSPITEQIVGMAYVLYNNVWNTNYILWYPYLEQDKNIRARFSVEFV